MKKMKIDNTFLSGVKKTAQQDSLVSELKLAVRKKEQVTESLEQSSSSESTLIAKKAAFTLGTLADYMHMHLQYFT